MPETAVDKDRQLPRAVNNVGIAGQVPAMQALAARDGIKDLAHRALGRRVARGDRAHDGGAVRLARHRLHLTLLH